RRDLEAIIHPVVYATIEAWFDRHRRRVAIADIPLLYETGRDRDFDRVIVAACPPEVQIARLIKRGAIDADAARQRLEAQMPIAEKKRRADYVIDTSGTFEGTDRQIDEVWGRLQRDHLPA